MATDYGGERFGADVPEKKRSTMATCLMGCLIVFVLALIVAVIAGIWVWQNWRDLAASAGSAAIKQGIEQSQLPPQQKQAINVQIDRIADAFRSGQLTPDKLAKLGEKLADSPLMTYIVASAIEVKYVAKSGLTADEKTAATQTLRRFLRGVVDKKIDEAAIDVAMAHVADRDGNKGSWKLREKVSDEDLRKFLTVAKAEADKAEIPDEPDDFDPSEEMKRIVDEELGGG